MLKTIKIVVLSIIIILFFNKQILSYFFLYSFSQWTNREILVDKFKINYYEGSIVIDNLRMKNLKEFYFNNIFESKKVIIKYNPKSLFTSLIIVNDLIIDNPKFFLEIIAESKEIYDDNIGLAKKITTNTPDKIWPKKNKDINFLILKVNIRDAKTFVKTSLSSTPKKINLSNMYFYNVGNEKNYQHYKDVLKTILFDLIGSSSDLKLKSYLKKIYNF